MIKSIKLDKITEFKGTIRCINKNISPVRHLKVVHKSIAVHPANLHREYSHHFYFIAILVTPGCCKTHIFGRFTLTYCYVFTDRTGSFDKISVDLFLRISK